MSSERFEDLEDDFIKLKDEINKKINNAQKSSGETKKSLLRELQRNLDEAQCFVEEMDNEIRKAPNPYRQQMNQRIRQYKQDFDQTSKRINKLDGSMRTELYNTRQPESGTPFNGERSIILQTHDILSRTTDSVHRSHQIAADTDQIGVAVVDELGTQREALIRTRDRLVATDDNLSKSRKILRSMYRRVITDKLILIILILLELAILSGVVWWKFFSKKSS